MGIRGERPNGYFVTFAGDGIKIEGETRQCAHCQYTWEYKPGSGRKYGLCLSCNGIICGNSWCKEDQKMKLQHIALHHPNLAGIHCIRFNDWNDLLAEEQLAIPGAKEVPGSSAIVIPGKIGEDLDVTPSGIIVKK